MFTHWENYRLWVVIMPFYHLSTCGLHDGMMPSEDLCIQTDSYLFFFWFTDVPFDANTPRKFLCVQWHIPLELRMKGGNCVLACVDWIVKKLNNIMEVQILLEFRRYLFQCVLFACLLIQFWLKQTLEFDGNDLAVSYYIGMFKKWKGWVSFFYGLLPLCLALTSHFLLH